MSSSIWLDGDVPGYPSLQGGLRADVVVVGGGITGCITAALLAEAGRQVVVLEGASIASGTTGNTTGKLTVLHGLKYARLAERGGIAAASAYAGANLAGIRTVLGLIERHGISCDLGVDDAITYATTPNLVTAIRSEVDVARRAGIDAEFTTQTELPFPVTAAIRVPEQHHFHARRFCLELVSRVAEAGVAVYENSHVTRVDQEGGEVRVETQQGSVTADHVVLATLSPIVDRAGFFARMRPERSYALALRLSAKAPMGMHINVEQPVRSTRPYPARGDDVLIVAGESHTVGREPDTQLRYEALEAWARETFDVVAVEAQWSAQDLMPFDLRPFVGSAGPGLDRVLVATGFQKWGLSNGAAAAGMVCDEILGRPGPFIDFFRSTRIGVGGVTKDLVTQNVGAVSRLITERVRSVVMSGPASIPPGHGGVVKVEGEAAAVYRDDEGEIHALSARCTHMGCFVAFNTAEKTWDCPCHGSRFGLDGSVLQGPAIQPLAPLDAPET